MVNTPVLAPSILAGNHANLAASLREAESIEEVTWIHLDIMDGHFVPNITFGPFIVEAIRKLTDRTLDTHLMIEDPLTYGSQFAAAGSDIVTFHIEAPVDPGATFDAIEAEGAKAGLVIRS